MKVERSCVICRRKFEKKTILRMVILDGVVVMDPLQQQQARGFYVCSDKGCRERLLKHKKYPITKEIAEAIL